MGTATEKIAVIGAGAWGTALALVAHRAGRQVALQAHDPETAAAIAKTGENATYLPSVKIPDAITVTADLTEALAGADAAILAMPAQFLRPVTMAMGDAVEGAFQIPVLVCAKGIELKTRKLMSEVLDETLTGAPQAVLSGPTFAIEVARDLPAAVTLAAEDVRVADALSHVLGTPRFRTYSSADPIGAQIGGAVKNVLAIACGIVEGRGLGENARAALITRGLAEIIRLGQAKGAEADTLSGLSGIGDLTLTCNAMQSRNFSLGVALGKGETLEDILAARKSVTEGVASAPAVIALAAELGVDMPICTAVNAVVSHGTAIERVIEGLLARPLGPEN